MKTDALTQGARSCTQLKEARQWTFLRGVNEKRQINGWGIWRNPLDVRLRRLWPNSNDARKIQRHVFNSVEAGRVEKEGNYH